MRAATARSMAGSVPATMPAVSPTCLEKSLGGAKKGGNSPLMEVYRYAEPVTAKGLVFMDTPGYDPASATGQIAGGANMIAFTTGPRFLLRLGPRADSQAGVQYADVHPHAG